MRARARFVCAYVISFCVDVERGPRMLERERALPSLITKPALLQTRLRHSQNDAVTSLRAAVAAHEKHRPSGVKTRRRQFPLIAMYSKGIQSVFLCGCPTTCQHIVNRFTRNRPLYFMVKAV